MIALPLSSDFVEGIFEDREGSIWPHARWPGPLSRDRRTYNFAQAGVCQMLRQPVLAARRRVARHKMTASTVEQWRITVTVVGGMRVLDDFIGPSSGLTIGSIAWRHGLAFFQDGHLLLSVRCRKSWHRR